MKMRNFSAALLAFCMMLALGSCGQHTDAEQSAGSTSGTSSWLNGSASESVAPTKQIDSITLAYYSTKGLHPYTCNNAANQMIAGLLYEPLFEINASFAATPCLALKCTSNVTSAKGPTSEDSSDGSSGDSSGGSEDQTETTTKSKIAGETDCTIELRDDVSFWNGETMSASDVVYSLEQAAKSGSIYKDRLSSMKSVRATGTNTVEITFNAANAAVETLLDIPIISSHGGGEFPVGTGPYQVQTKDGKAQKLTLNQNWWQGKQLPAKQVNLYKAQDSDMLIFGFGSGAVSMVATDITGTGSLTYTGEYNVVDYPTTDLIYVGCNTRSGPCQTKAFRQVLSYAFDRDTLTTKMLSGHATEAVLPVSPESSLYNKKLAGKYASSEDKAKKALQDAAYYGRTLTLIVNSESTFKTAFAAELKKELESVGINVEIKKLAWSDFSKALDQRDFDLYLGEVKLTSDFDITELVSKKGSLNYGGYSDSDMDQLLTAYQTAAAKKRSAAASKLYEAVADEAPIVPLCFKNNSVLTHWSSESEITPTQQNLFYHFTDWKLQLDSNTADESNR